MSEFESGHIIDGRYRVLHRLGAGGMADVYLAKISSSTVRSR